MSDVNGAHVADHRLKLLSTHFAAIIVLYSTISPPRYSVDGENAWCSVAVKFRARSDSQKLERSMSEAGDALTEVATDAGGTTDAGQSEAGLTDPGSEGVPQQANNDDNSRSSPRAASRGSDKGGHSDHSDHEEHGHHKKKKEKKHKKHRHRHGHKEEEKEHKRVVMFICDPQNDYSDEGSIPIPNANADSNRIYDMIKDHMDDILEIYVSLDSRHRTHISNPISWVNKKGDMPEPFTIITASEVIKGRWKARQRVSQQDFVDYVSKVEANSRLPFTIWPDHCLIGTWGQAVMPQINEALQDWAAHRLTTVEYIIKGTNTHTEMYSAICSEVPNPNDPSTELDLGMIERLKSADRVIICGQSLSHTVQMTMKDILSNWKADEVDKLMLLTDCSSPVPGFEAMAETFVREMKEKGVKCSSVGEAFEWPEPEHDFDADDIVEAAAIAQMGHKLALKAHKKHAHDGAEASGGDPAAAAADRAADKHSHKHHHSKKSHSSGKHGDHHEEPGADGGAPSGAASDAGAGEVAAAAEADGTAAGTDAGAAAADAGETLMAPSDAE